MPIAHLPHLDMYYEVHEAVSSARGAQDPPLLLVHGATETFRTGWQQQTAVFARQYQVIGVDLRGHGRSSNPANKLDMRQMANDISDLLDFLHIKKVHLLGFSGGGTVSLYFGAQHQHRLASLTLVSNTMELDDTRTNLNFWNPERIAHQQPRWWQAMTGMHEHPVTQLLQWWAEEDRKRPDFTPAKLAHITVPALVVGGDRDSIIPLSQTMKLFETLPDAYLCILPGMGHGAPRQRPQAFNQVVLDFLNYVETRFILPKSIKNEIGD